MCPMANTRRRSVRAFRCGSTEPHGDLGQSLLAHLSSLECKQCISKLTFSSNSLREIGWFENALFALLI